MATILLTDVIFYKNGIGGVSGVVGNDWNSATSKPVSRIARYIMTAPESGASKVSFRFSDNYHGNGEYPELRFHINQDSTSHIQADMNSVYTGSLSRSDCIYEGSTDIILMPGETYYVWVFPANNVYGWMGWSKTLGYAVATVSGGAASTFDCGNGTLGSEFNITVEKYSVDFTHTITYQCAGVSGTVVSKASNTNIAWTPPLSLASTNTSGTSVLITFTLQTYFNNTPVGNASSKTVILSIPNHVKPSCTVNVSDAMGYYEQYGAYVNGLSILKVAVNPTIAYGSNIVSYRTTVNNNAYTTPEFEINVLRDAKSVTISTVVTDERGRTSDPTTIVITNILDYSRPAILSLTVDRCNANGTQDAQGSYALVTFSASATPLNSRNDPEYILYYKKTSDHSYTGIALDDLYGACSVKDYAYIFQADEAYSYDVEISVEDDHYGTTRATTVSTAFTLMHFNANGTGIGIGKLSERSNTIEFGVPVYDDYGQFESVIEGSSGIWHYKKWLNGDVELWGKYQVSNIDCKTALGGLYRTAVFTTPEFPFKVYYGCSVASYESDGYGAMLWATTTTTDSRPPSYYLIRPVSGTIVSGEIVFHVKGRWET